MIRTQSDAQLIALKKNALTRRKLRKSVAACLPSAVGVESLEQRLAFSIAGATLAGPVLTQGSTWTYLITTAAGETASYYNTVIGPTSYNGKAVTEYDNVTGRSVNKSYLGFIPSGDLVIYGTHDESENFGTSDDVYSPYEVAYPKSLTAGVPITNEYTDTYTSPNSDGSTTTSVTTEDDTYTLVSETPSPLTVPFGTFDAYQIHYVSSTTSIGGNGEPVTDSGASDQWYAPGIGLLKATDDNGNKYELTNFQTAAHHLVFTTQPTDSAEGDKIPTVKVAVEDTAGKVDTDAVGSITISLGKVKGDGKLTGTVTKPIVNGVATFADLVVDAGGTYTLTAVDDASPPVALGKSAQFNVTTAALVWTGKGDGVDWSDAKNWDKNVAPKNTDSLLFPAGAPLNSVNDIASLSIAAIDIAGAGYTLSGNAISLTGGLTSEGGTNTYTIDTKLVDSPTIKAVAGKLDVKSVLSGGGGMTVAGAGTVLFEKQNTYTGPTTLAGGVTIADAALTGAFGTGALNIGVGTVTLANTGTGPATLENDITFKDGATLATDPFFELEGNIIVNGKVALQPIDQEDGLKLDGNISGTGTLTLKGNGTIEIDGDVAATIKLLVSSAELSLGGNLLAVPAANQVINQVTVAGGTLKLLNTLRGEGSIDLQTGTIESSGAPNYTGTVTLENYQGAGKADVNLRPSTNPLGTGLILIGAPSGSTDPKAVAIVPTIRNTALVGAAVKLLNRVQFLNNSRLALSNDIDFASEIDVAGTGYIDGVAKAGTFNFTGNLENIGTLVLNNGGTINLSGDVSDSVDIREENADGIVNLAANLKGIVGGKNQVVLAAGTLNLKSGLTGKGGIDVLGGILTAAGLPAYGGTVTVETAKTPDIAASLQIAPAAMALGTGQLVFAATPKGSTGAPLLENPATVLALTLNNEVLFQGASIQLKGAITFAGNDTVTGINTLTVPNGSLPSFTGTQLGKGTLAFSTTKATVTLAGTIGDTVLIEVDGTLPELDLGANLLADVAADAQVTMKAGTLKFLSTVKGTGGINLLAGKITTPGGLSNYKGNILISQGDTFQNTLTSAPGKDVFGTGQIKITDAGGGYTLIPLLVNSAGTQVLTLDNSLVFDAHSSLQTEGSINFTQQPTLTSDDHFQISAGSVVAFTAGLKGKGTLDLFGKGDVTVSGTIEATANIDLLDQPDTFGGPLNSLTLGSVALSGLANQITIHAGTLVLQGVGSKLGPITGGGGINMLGGTLTTDATQPVAGSADYTGPIAVNAGVTAYYRDAFDNYGFGSGILTLNGATLQNAPNPGSIPQPTTGLKNPIVIKGASYIDSGPAPQRFKLIGALTIASGELTVSGDVVVQGLLTGSGNLTLASGNTLLEVAGSNPAFSGKVTVSGGAINVVKDHPLGSGDYLSRFFSVDPLADIKGAIHQVTSILDPIIDNHLTVESGTMDLQGLLTFPAGIAVKKDATLEINKGETVISGPLTGAGNIVVAQGATLTITGDRSGFTGTITYVGPITKTTPTLTVADAGGVFTGNPFPATATLTGTSGPSSTLDGVAPTFAYYVGSTATGTASAIAPTNPGTYTVVAAFAGSTHYNAVLSSPVTFVITPSAATTAPKITQNPTTTSFVAGVDVLFTAAASGNPVPTVQWQVSTDGGQHFTNIAGATSITLHLGAATASQSGRQYRAVFTNSKGTATTTAATLTVTPIVLGTGTIRGTLWNDSDGDGLFDHGEVATGKRTVFIDTDGNGKLDVGEQSTMSDAAGRYAFTNVPTGVVTISRLFPTGYHLSNPSAGSNGNDVVTTVTAGGTLVVNLGTTNRSKPTPPPLANGTISGLLWNDSDADGLFDHGETPTGVRTVFIDANGNGKLDAGEKSTRSDAKGGYTFSNIPIGSTRISRLFPTGYHLSNATAGSHDLLVNVVANTTTTANLGTTNISKPVLINV